MDKAEMTECYVAPDPIPMQSLSRLSPRLIKDEGEIRQLLEYLRRERIRLRSETESLLGSRSASVSAIEPPEMLLEIDGQIVSPNEPKPFLIRFEILGKPHFFSVTPAGLSIDGRLRVELPYVIYETERRDRRRVAPDRGSGDWVSLRIGRHPAIDAEVLDRSPGGLSVAAPLGDGTTRGTEVEILGLESGSARNEVVGEVRNCRALAGRTGWQRVGLAVFPLSRCAEPQFERLEDLGNIATADQRSISRSENGTLQADHSGRTAGRTRLGGEPFYSEVVEYFTSEGEKIRAIVDTVGDPRRAPAVIVPPAWGKTKESLVLLADTILATFRGAAEPVTVVRFDGIRKRGESYNDKECLTPGLENLNYSVTQGATDILATMDFLRKDSRYSPASTIIVSFSIASIEARVAIVRANGKGIGGWISVVGGADLQSVIRAVSGGIDFVGGAERGVRFGRQDVQGILLDIDNAATDAIRNGIGFLEDARRDMASVQIPVTWICGRYDAWMDIDRVRDILSFGKIENRKIVEVPTGHRLRTSRDAQKVFQIISGEAGRMALGRAVNPVLLDEKERVGRRRGEQRGPVAPSADIRGFWKEYLLGSEGKLGMDLITSTSLYRELMRQQIEQLNLGADARICDLGSGVGTFPMQMIRSGRTNESLQIVEVDIVREALRESRERIAIKKENGRIGSDFVAANLNLTKGTRALPLLDSVFDSVLLSLVVNYVDNPESLLSEANAILKPGGNLVVSSLRKDADISMIFARGLAELRAGGAREFLGDDERRVGESLQGFVSNAARVLDFEERGRFRFWDEAELRELVLKAGFLDVSIVPVFGHPPQAYLCSAYASTDA